MTYTNTSYQKPLNIVESGNLTKYDHLGNKWTSAFVSVGRLGSFERRIDSLSNSIRRFVNLFHRLPSENFAFQHIGNRTFFHLDVRSLPQDIRTVGFEGLAFSGLRSVKMPFLYELGDAAFKGCKHLKHVDLSDSHVNTIPFACFKDCRRLDYVSIPGSVSVIEESAFENSLIRNFDLPLNINTIEKRAFANSRIEGVLYFPNSITSIQEQAFSGTLLSRVYVPTSCEVALDAFPPECKVITVLPERFIECSAKLYNQSIIGDSSPSVDELDAPFLQDDLEL